MSAMLAAVPDTGVATFLFSDVEDSTGLLRRLGDAYSELLEQHQELMRSAVEAQDGRCADIEGDGMFAVFTTATAACRAAVAAQLALSAHPWPDNGEFRVRIGLHTGEAQRLESEPVGLAVHQSQRVCSAGHGGQVVISEATRQMVMHSLPAGTTLRDLGEFDLRNFDGPQRLFQVCCDGLPNDFPAPRAPAVTAAGTSSATRALRVLLVDDQELIRAGLRMILQPQPGVEVVGEAADGLQAVSEAARLHPDVILMDIRMPNLDGIEATRQIVAADANAKIVILTTFDLDEYVYRAIQAGASGFLLKDAPPADLVAALGIVARGDALLAPAVTRRLLDEFAKRPQSGTHPAATLLATLTDRENEVLRLMARGLSNAEIGERLFVGENTVKTHVSAVFNKLGVRHRVRAVVLAYEAGIVAPGDPVEA
ncbi:MAG TPA: response regulator [Acidimicrobiales bacterium]|nr:response regulator [Acidimicrobiales bacterium]